MSLSINDNAREMPTPLVSIGGWHLVPGQTWDEMNASETALANLFIDMFPSAVAAANTMFPLPEQVTAYVTLGGEQEAYDWECDLESLGFHAVAAHKVDGDTGEHYIDVNEHNEAVINLSALALTIEDDSGDDASIKAGLVTMPHEMAHVLAWLIASKGKSPMQVFDDEDGEPALKRIGKLVEIESHDRGKGDGPYEGAEDEAESFGRDFVDGWMTMEVRSSHAWIESVSVYGCRSSPRP